MELWRDTIVQVLGRLDALEKRPIPPQLQVNRPLSVCNGFIDLYVSPFTGWIEALDDRFKNRLRAMLSTPGHKKANREKLVRKECLEESPDWVSRHRQRTGSTRSTR